MQSRRKGTVARARVLVVSYFRCAESFILIRKGGCGLASSIF